MTTKPWYELTETDQLDTPALLIYPDRAEQNIKTLIELAGGTGRLRPHVKTHKMAEIAKMHLDLGINKFKCATIAEAEMLATAGAKDILLAYQPVGPRTNRLARLAKAYPTIEFGCVIDDPTVLEQLATACAVNGVIINVWLDIDNGMARSGIAPNDAALALYKQAVESKHIQAKGLHVYDGHIRIPDITERTAAGNEAFTAVYNLVDQIKSEGLGTPNVVAGGSPAFSYHARREGVDPSPGTYVFWDYNYGSKFTEVDFKWAAVIMTRVASKPGENHLCLDVGSKGVSPDQPLDRRIYFLNLAEQPEFIGQSEEHLVVKVTNQDDYKVGDVWYGVPGHVCPTINLYQEANIVSANGAIEQTWQVVARSRQLTY